MPANRPATSVSSAELKGETDFAKVDAHIVQLEEYEELPELTDEFFERADFYIGDTLIRRGRPKLDSPKKLVSLRIDQAALEAFKATGAGWQTRMNEVLVRAAKRLRPAAPRPATKTAGRRTKVNSTASPRRGGAALP